MALRAGVKATPVAFALGIPVEPKRTRVIAHEIDERYARAAWTREVELHQSRWTYQSRQEFMERAKHASLAGRTDFSSGVAACFAHQEGTPLDLRAVEPELVPGRGGFIGLRPSVRPSLRERPMSARGTADHCRPQLCQARPGTTCDAGNVRDRTLWRMAGLESRDAPPTGGMRGLGGVLRFDVAFDYQPIDAPSAVRAPATLLFYLEDDSVQINMPKEPSRVFEEGLDGPGPNEFGDRRGRVFLKRARVLSPDGSLAVRVERDLNVGQVVMIHARAFEILGCDTFTREFLSHVYGQVPDDMAAPHSAKNGTPRTGDEARRGVGVALPHPNGAPSGPPFGLRGSRHMHTGGKY